MRHLLFFVVLSLTHVHAANAWDNFFSHERLANEAVSRVIADSRLVQYLREDLGLDDGVAETLAIQIGFDGTIDADLFRPGGPGSRLLDNLNEGELDPSDASFPSQILIELNEGPPCARDASFHVCFESRARFDIERLIRLGTFAEDNPNPRARHHFHDPTREHAPPAGSHGLDDGFRMLRGWDRLLADVATRLLGRGPDRRRSWLRYLTDFFFPDLGIDPRDFDLRGRSARDRALNRPIAGSFPSNRSPRNLFALPDAERYLHRALTSPLPDEREHYLALHFLAFGHVLHLLQDMGSVGHVRNDFVLEHALVPEGLGWLNLEGAPDWPEKEKTYRVGGDVVERIRRAGTQSEPARFLRENPSGTFAPADYRRELGLVPEGVLAQFDVADFWDEPPLDTPGLDGLAELVQRNFLSSGTVSNSALLRGYPRPFVPDCQDPGSALGSGDERVWIADLPERRVVNGERLGAGTLPYLSSSRVPHLGRCRAHCLIPAAAVLRPGLCGTLADESVMRDYLELLWPQVIHYSAQLMRSYFTPRLHVIPVGSNAFRLANRTPLELRFAEGTLQVVYDTIDAETQALRRVRVDVSCNTALGEYVLAPAESYDQPGPPSDFVCTLPAAVPEPPSSSDDFWVVVRGALGARGQVGTPEEYDDGSKDFVVAFERVLPRIAFMGTTDHEAGTDVERQADVYEARIDPSRSVGADERGPASRSLTGPLREAVGNTFGLTSAELLALDFGMPSSESSGSRLVLLGDLEGPGDPQEPWRFFPTEPWVLDRAADGQGALRLLDLGGRSFVFGLPRGVVWNRTSGATDVTFRVHDGGGVRLVTQDVVGVPAPGAPEPNGIGVTSQLGTRLAGTLERNNQLDLVLVDAATAEITHVFDMATRTVRSCAPSCPAATESRAQVAGDFAPDGREIVFVDAAPLEGTGELQVAVITDFQGDPLPDGPIFPLQDATGSAVVGQDPAWSPDGAWIAYAFEGEIYVVPAGGGADPVRVTRDPLDKELPTWLPRLRLSAASP